MKKPIIIIVIISTIIIAVAGVLYRQYTSTPRYSLSQAKKAFEEHDLASFEKYVDIEGVTNSLVEQILETASEHEKPKDEWGQLGEWIGKGLVTLLKPQLSKIVKQHVVELVETGKFEKKKESKESQESEFSISEIWDKTGAKKIVLKVLSI